jgi:hypothetical protein
VASYLRDHLANITLNGEDNPEQLLENLVEKHLDYLGGLAETGMIRSVSLTDQLSERNDATRRSTFRFLGVKARKTGLPNGL